MHQIPIQVMAALEAQDDQPVGRIARVIKVDNRSAKRAVVFLQAIGWATVTQHAGDERKTTFVRLTYRGRSVLLELFQTVERPRGIVATSRSEP